MRTLGTWKEELTGGVSPNDPTSGTVSWTGLCPCDRDISMRPSISTLFILSGGGKEPWCPPTEGQIWSLHDEIGHNLKTNDEKAVPVDQCLKGSNIHCQENKAGHKSVSRMLPLCNKGEKGKIRIFAYICIKKL